MQASENYKYKLGSPTCDICLTAIEVANGRGIAPCGHDNVCGICHLRLRHLHRDNKCPICKTENDRIIVDLDELILTKSDVWAKLLDGSRPGDDLQHKEEVQYLMKLYEEEYEASSADKKKKSHKSSISHMFYGMHQTYSSYPQWGDDIGNSFTFREDVSMFLPVSLHQRVVMPLFSLDCNIPGECKDPNFSNGANKSIKKLHEHLQKKHGRYLCKLCVVNQRDFVSQLPRFTAYELKRHEQNGDGPSSGFKGHPQCKFCKKRFYDNTKLHEHLNKEHYKCHICEKQGKPNQFFRDYAHLQRHFEQAHYLCLDPQCLAARFVVFENEIELRVHEREVHGVTTRRNDNKIKLDFRVRSSNNEHESYEDGLAFDFGEEAFVPEALDSQRQYIQENEPVITNEFHRARTAEFRREAARMRSLENSGESFPALGTENAMVRRSRSSGWLARPDTETRGANLNAEDAFPSLSSSGTSRTTNNVSSTSSRKPKQVLKLSRAPIMPSAMSASQVIRSSRPAAVTQTGLSSKSSWPDLPAAAVTAPPTRQNPASGGWGVRSSSSAPPSLSGEDAFPALGGGAPDNYAKANAFAKEQKKKLADRAVNNNILKPPSMLSKTVEKVSPEEAKAKLDAMKLYLGKEKYKQLKTATKIFASGSVEAEDYIDSAVLLFGGVNDSGFIDFMPTLVNSCPNRQSVGKALVYMDTLCASQNGNSKQIKEGENSKKVEVNKSWGPHAAPSLPVSQPKKKIVPKNGWGDSSTVIARATGIASVAIAQQQAQNQLLNVNKKPKSKTKSKLNKELQDLAFSRR